MSYRGRPSKGCESCRGRKIKCDESKPICNRCSKSGYECRYRDQSDLLFRNQTAFAAQKAEESWRQRSKSNQRAGSDNSSQSIPVNRYSPVDGDGSQPTESSTEISAAPFDLNSLSIGQDPQAGLRHAAYLRFIYDFVIHQPPGEDAFLPSESMWTFIPDLYERAAEGSCLRAIVDATALVNFSSRVEVPQALVLGKEYFGKGLKLVQKAISDKKQAASDEVLATVYVLGVYETLTSSKHDGTFLAHKEGLNALLKLRSVNEFYKDMFSARLYEVSFATMLISNLQSAKPPALPIEDLVAAKQFLPSMQVATGIFVVQLVHSAAHLHAKWHETKHSSYPPSNRQELHGLLKEALEMDAEFQAWETTTPPQWKHSKEPNTPEVRAKHDPTWADRVLSGSGAPSEIHTCSSLKQAWVWMFYRTTRLFILRDLIEMINWMFKLPESDVSAPGPDVTSAPGRERNTIAPGKAVSPVDNATLHIHHCFSTTHLVSVIEKLSSEIAGNFTVPIYGKSAEDVVGLRGYISLWPLGAMDAVLRMGLVPDSGPATSLQPPQQNWNPFHNMPAPSPNVFRMPEQNMNPLYHNPATAQLDPDDFPRLDPILSQDFAPIPDVSMLDFSQVPQPSDLNPPRPHAFDSGPVHPFSMPSELPSLSFTPPQPSKIDVKARREWVHRVLLYMGTELGIKKGMAVLAYVDYIESKNTGIESVHGLETVMNWRQL